MCGSGSGGGGAIRGGGAIPKQQFHVDILIPKGKNGFHEPIVRSFSTQKEAREFAATIHGRNGQRAFVQGEP